MSYEPDSLPISASRDEAYAFAVESDRRAQANHRRALDNFDNIVPWRWWRWFRENRAIKRELRATRRRIQAHRTWKASR